MATLINNIPAILRQMRTRSARHVRETAASIEGDIKQGMREPKSGRTDERDGSENSAPGESPAIDTGSYADSIQTAQVDETTAAVGTDDERGPVLELGGVKIQARPHFAPAFERAGEDFEQGVREIFEG